MGNILKGVKDLAIFAGRRLPQRVRNSLFHFAYACAPAEFERFAFLYASGQEQCLRQMARNGFNPRTIVDVGAYRGDWSRMAHAIWPNAAIVMIEPNREQTAGLDALAVELHGIQHCELLGPVDGQEVSFHLMATGSSVLPERSDVPRRTETRKLVTLDTLLAEMPEVGLLKIDAQGYELSILDGAVKILPKVQAVLMEIALIEVNDGSPILHEVVRYMHDRGFVAFDVLEMHRRWLDRALCQIDILFCRKDAAIRSNKRFC